LGSEFTSSNAEQSGKKRRPEEAWRIEIAVNGGDYVETVEKRYGSACHEGRQSASIL